MNRRFACDFHPVILIDEVYQVLDFTSKQSSMQKPTHRITIGRYNEKRPYLYHQSMFDNSRHYHMGIDLGAPAGTNIHAFDDGEIFLFTEHKTPGDYGPTIITKHQIEGIDLYALHGHLSKDSLTQIKCGQQIKKGEVFATIGDQFENGGWPPHVHFQLSYKAPKTANMPGVVSEQDLKSALSIYPDPRIVLGPIY
jgi:murein DD-endopeptidase MepM/ murein hydrolase activator NlpD